MFPWCCEIKALHPCQALRGQIPGSLKAAACLIRSPYRAAQRHPSLSAQDLFFNKNDQDGSPCSTLCCAGCSAEGLVICRLSLAVLMSVWATWSKQSCLIALKALPSHVGLTHSGHRQQLQDSLCRYEFLNGVFLLPSGFLHRLHYWVVQGTGAHSLGLLWATQPSAEDAAWLFW